MWWRERFLADFYVHDLTLSKSFQYLLECRFLHEVVNPWFDTMKIRLWHTTDVAI